MTYWDEDVRTLDEKIADTMDYWDHKLSKPVGFLLCAGTYLVLFGLPLAVLFGYKVALLALIPSVILSYKDNA